MVFQVNEERLFLFWVVVILDALKPSISDDQGTAFGPKLLEKLPGCDSFYSGVDRVRAFVLGPERRPASVGGINSQALIC